MFICWISEAKACFLSKVNQALKLSVFFQQAQRRFQAGAGYDFNININVHSERKRLEKLRSCIGILRKGAWSANRMSGRGRASDTIDWTGEEGAVEIESPCTAAKRDRAAVKAHVSEARRGAPVLREAK